MPTSVLMPKFGLTMTEGKIVEWRKKEGDEVTKGEILFIFETEKVTYEVEASESGILGRILVKVDETVPVGTTVGYIVQRGEKIPEVAIPPEALAETREEVTVAEAAPVADGQQARSKATPKARKLAKKYNIDLKLVRGSGLGGRIRRIDIEKAREEREKGVAPPAKPPSGKLVKFTGMRKIIAQKMLQSKTQTAQAYMGHTVDASKILESREIWIPIVEKKAGVRLTITDMMMKITAAAIEIHPIMNTRWTDEGILWIEDIHMGMALALDEGLIVPVIWNINRKNLSEIAKMRAELVQKGRKGQLTPDDMKGSTFTLSAMGMYGLEDFLPIINQPESAILGVGAIMEKPVVVDKEIVIRPMMKITLAYDHRVIDGAKAGQFMMTLKEFIENPFSRLA
jgi:pyruvate dehydrogenase E2 component (dihydrolipoamide acetyltransferase)